MAEENDNKQNAPENEPKQQPSKQQQSYQQSPEEQRQISYERMAEVNRKNNELERQLQERIAKEEQEAEERARKQGEYENLANKYKTQVEQEKQKRQAAENSLVRYKRLTTWRQAARGVIRDEALEDAFSMLDPDDFAGLDDADEQGMTRLAEVLADRKPYLAEAPRGAGSGFGSRTPVLERPTQAKNPAQSSAPKNIFAGKRKRRAWK